jgi:hypothetical protein
VRAVNAQGFESRGSDPKLGTVQKWRRALELGGVEFLDPVDDKGSGVRFRSPDAEKKLAGKKR